LDFRQFTPELVQPPLLCGELLRDIALSARFGFRRFDALLQVRANLRVVLTVESAFEFVRIIGRSVSEGFDSHCELVDARLLHLHFLHGDLRGRGSLELDAELADFFDEGVWPLLSRREHGYRGRKDKSSHQCTPDVSDEPVSIGVERQIC
jgi:hypothetical protein